MVVKTEEIRDLFIAKDKLEAGKNPVEDVYEYSIEDTDIERGTKTIGAFWKDDLEVIKDSVKMFRMQQQVYVDYGGHVWHTYRIIKRLKQPYTYVEEEGA